jgi:hypothetical protein
LRTHPPLDRDRDRDPDPDPDLRPRTMSDAGVLLGNGQVVIAW